MDSFVPLNSQEPELSKEECDLAVNELVKKPYRVFRKNLHDPKKPGEPQFALFSFAKAAGATPDKDGFLGVAKIRGVFYGEEDAARRAEEIIRYVDSSNVIWTAICGEPIPLVPKGFSKNLTEVDISNKIAKAVSDNVRAKRKEEEREMQEIKNRQEALMNDDGTVKESIDPEDKYVEQRVKLAHLRYAIVEHEKKMKECAALEVKVRDSLREYSKENPEFEANFVQRYKEGRRKANIAETTDFGGFMQYFLDPIDPIEGADPSYIS